MPSATAGPAGGLDAISGGTVRLGVEGAEDGGEDPWGSNVTRAWSRPSETGGTLTDAVAARGALLGTGGGRAGEPCLSPDGDGCGRQLHGLGRGGGAG